MDLERFQGELPGLYADWGQASVRSRSSHFAQVLERVRGMTSANVLQLLNFAVACLEPGEAYCEVGCFHGATLIGALLGQPARQAFAVDNFSEFDPEGANQRVLLRNLAAFGLQDQVCFHSGDFEEWLLALRKSEPQIGVYLYDGAHDYRSQLMGLLLAVPLLADRALLVVDDSNCPAVKQATWDFLAVHPECQLLFDLPTPRNGDPSFWNGLMVLGWERRSTSGYDWPAFRQARQPALLESLYLLQRANLKPEGRTVQVVPIDGA